MDSPTLQSRQLTQVLGYRSQGWWVIDTAIRSKIPNNHEVAWQNQRLTAEQLSEHFSSPQNVSLLLGLEPKILIDIDLDTTEAALAARGMMPATAAMFGRQGRGISHYLYEVDTVPKTRAWRVGKDKIIELRSKGHQTVIPTSIHEKGMPIEWVLPNGKFVDQPFGPCPGQPGKVDVDDLIEAVDYVAAVAAMVAVWEKSGRHEMTLALAGGLARAHYPKEEAVTFVQRICEVAGDEDELANHIRTIAVLDTYKKWEAGDRQLRGWPSLEEELPGNGRFTTNAVRNWLHLTNSSRSDGNLPKLNDSGNADRFVDLYQGQLRYNDDTGQWLAWEGTRWKPGRTSTAIHLAGAVGVEIQKDAIGIPNPKEQEAIWKFGVESRNLHRIRAMVGVAQTRPELLTYSTELDIDPADVNLINFTYNLETMSHRPHRQEDMITRLCPVNYNPSVRKNERWEAFLDDVTDGDSDFRRYLQKAAGLSMSGYADEEVLFIAHGPAATGKTTFLETLRAVLGDYSTATSPEVFLAGMKSNSGAARPDLIKLMGKRFVTAVEIDEGRHLAHSVVKMITGGDTMAARPLYKEEIEFKPICKVWIATNNDPGIRANDTGMWRRVHILNFHHQIPEERQDKHLKAYLADLNEVGPALLNWMIEGYRMYKEEGLAKPDIVRRATEEYRQQEDFMFDFFALCCEQGPSADVRYRARGNDLMKRYNEWAKMTGNPILATNVLAQRFKDKGFIPHRGANGRTWYGVRLRDSAEVFGMAQVQLEEGEDAVVA